MIRIWAILLLLFLGGWLVQAPASAPPPPPPAQAQKDMTDLKNLSIDLD